MRNCKGSNQANQTALSARKTLSSCTHYGKSGRTEKYTSATTCISLYKDITAEQDITRKVALISIQNSRDGTRNIRRDVKDINKTILNLRNKTIFIPLTLFLTIHYSL